MKVNQKKVGDNELLLECVASAEDVDRAFFACGVIFAQQNNLQPEAGKTPAQVAEAVLGIKDLDSIIAPNVVEYLMPFAIDKKGLIPAATPVVEPKSPLAHGQEFRFDLKITLKQDYVLTSYEPVEIKLPRFVADEETADMQIKEMATHFTTYVSADPKPIENGDACAMSMTATMNGEPVEALTAKGRTYVAGEGLMPEGFDKQIIGMNVGDTKTFTFEGPGMDEDGNPVSEVVECTVTIDEIQKAVVPEIDDEWVAKNFPIFKDLNAMREAVSANVNKARRIEYDLYCSSIATEAMASRFEGSIPDACYESMSQNMIKNIRTEAARNGVTWEEFIKQQGGEQQFNMMLMIQTRQMLVQGYVLDSVFTHQNLKVTDADILGVCATVNPQDPGSVRRNMEETGRNYALREMAQRFVASKWIMDNAVIEYVD